MKHIYNDNGRIIGCELNEAETRFFMSFCADTWTTQELESQGVTVVELSYMDDMANPKPCEKS